MKSTFKGQRCPITNELLPNTVADFTNHHISYNASSRDYGCDTTALVFGNNLFLILCGNHKENLDNAADGDARLQYFLDNIKEAHGFSDHKHLLPGAADPFKLRDFTLEKIGAPFIHKLEEIIQ